MRCDKQFALGWVGFVLSTRLLRLRGNPHPGWRAYRSRRPDVVCQFGQVGAGHAVTVSATADENFYAGLFSRVDFHRYYGRKGEPFAFEFGTDSGAYTKRVVIDQSDEYYFVLRVGVFSGTAAIHARITLQRPKAGLPVG